MFIESPKGDIVNAEAIIAVNFEHEEKTNFAVYTDSSIIVFEYDSIDAHDKAVQGLERILMDVQLRWALAGSRWFRADRIKAVVKHSNGYATVHMGSYHDFRIRNERVAEMHSGLKQRLMCDDKVNFTKL